LQDGGLRTVVTDMAGSVATRSKMRAHINVAAELPEIPQQVSLHIYRIIQECLNNMEKHSRASEFRVDLGASDGILLVDVADNGVGFDTGASDKRKAAQGGMGLDSIRERVELIRCFYPAQLWIQSKPGAGAKVTVQINLNRGA
jgi:signal transduction histidine kinase